MKAEIITQGLGSHDVQVLIVGQDVTKNLTDINVNIKAGDIPTLKLEFIPDEMLIQGDYEVIKKAVPLEKKDKINNKYTKFAEKINALAETVEELAVMEDKDSKGLDVSASETYALMGKFMMQIMELQQGIPE